MKNRKASVLLFVLGLIFASSIIALGVAEYASRSLKLRASSAWENDLRLDAYSALNAAIAALQEYEEIDGGLYGEAQGWGSPVEEGRLTFASGTEVKVKISDAAAKLPLCALKSLDLEKIFVDMGISSTDAQEMADCIIDWSDADESASIRGAEYDDYDTNGVHPPNRKIRSFDEFKYIKKVNDVFFDKNGEPNEFFKTFMQGISLDFYQKVNLNAASEATLRMMLAAENKDFDASLYPAIHGDIGAVSDGVTWVKNATEISNRGASEIPLTYAAYKVSVLKIEVTARRGAGEYYLCAYLGTPTAISYYAQQTQAVQKASSSSTSTMAASNAGKSSGSASKSSDSAAGASSKSTAQTLSKAISASARNSSASQAAKKGSNYKVFKLSERGG